MSLLLSVTHISPKPWHRRMIPPILCVYGLPQWQGITLTHAFASSTTATTVGDKGEVPRGSTKLNEEKGHNCCMMGVEFQMFVFLIFGIDPMENMPHQVGVGT